VFAVILDWPHLDIAQKIAFVGLSGLGIYMLYRNLQVLKGSREVTDHVGFILISLFDGFAIVSAIDLHAPGWIVAVIAIGAVALGIFLIKARKKHILR
jgi:hypothetical protein